MLKEQIAGILCADCNTHQKNHQCKMEGTDYLDCYGYLADQIHKEYKKAGYLSPEEVEVWQADFTDKMATKYDKRVAEVQKQERERITEILDGLAVMSKEEMELAVNKWLNAGTATRYIRLGRGHYEDIMPVIAQTQLDRIINKIKERLGKLDSSNDRVNYEEVSDKEGR